MDYVRLWTYYRPNWSFGFYIILVILFAGIIMWAKWKKCDMERLVSAYLLGVYMVYILSITLLNRQPFEGLHFEPHIFWSYKRIMAGEFYFIEENFLNLLMLMPVGLLFPVVFGTRFRKTARTAFFITLIIELLQLVTKTGLFEFDDMIHNTIGAMLGYGIYKLSDKNRKRE